MGREFLTELSLSDTDCTIIEPHLSVIDGYDQQIERLERKTERRVLESPAAQRLLTIPGVGQYTAGVIVAEVGEIERFDEDKQLVSCAGLDSVVHQSSDKEVRRSISREGSAPLCWGPSSNAPT